MSSQTTTGATPATTDPLSSSFITAISSSATATTQHYPGQPVPPAMTTGLAEWPGADGSSSSGGGGRGREKLWLLALLPLFILVVVAVYFVAARLRIRAKRRGRRRNNLAAVSGATTTTTGDTGPGGAIIRAVGMDGVVLEGVDGRDDDEKTLVGKDEGIVIKAEGKAKTEVDIV